MAALDSDAIFNKLFKTVECIKNYKKRKKQDSLNLWIIEYSD